MGKKYFGILLLCISLSSSGQDITQLLQKVKTKLNLINNYEASGRIKTNIAFLKVPVAKVKVYYKKPDKLKIINEKGFSFIPKGAVSINLSNLLSTDNYTAIDGGIVKIGNGNVRIVKLLFDDDNDIVLTTLFIDEANAVIKKSKTNTRDNGSYELEMGYGKYIQYGLADKVEFSFSTKHKLPKGFTFDFDEGSKNKNTGKKVPEKGKIEITYSSYTINKGIPESVFR